MGKMYIRIVANYFSFLVILESPNHFPVVISLSFDWLIQKVSQPVRDRDWRKSPDLAQLYVVRFLQQRCPQKPSPTKAQATVVVKDNKDTIPMIIFGDQTVNYKHVLEVLSIISFQCPLINRRWRAHNSSNMRKRELAWKWPKVCESWISK